MLIPNLLIIVNNMAPTDGLVRNGGEEVGIKRFEYGKIRGRLVELMMSW